MKLDFGPFSGRPIDVEADLEALGGSGEIDGASPMHPVDREHRAYGVVLGILGTLVGIAQAATAIQAAGGTVQSALVWGGVRVALITVIFGFLIFSVALVAWFVLRVRYRRAVAAV